MSSEPAGETSVQEVSAGGVVVREGEVAVIVPTRRAADGSRVLALPKGHMDPGETALQAAEREVREETGVDVVPVCELGKARYCYRRHGRTIAKSVTWFLFSYRAGDIADHDEAVIDQVEVMKLSELSPRDIKHDNPEFRRHEELINFLEQIYARPVSTDDIVTVVRFSQILDTPAGMTQAIKGFGGAQN